MKTTLLNEAWLITGGNMGDRKWFLEEAQQHIAAQCGDLIKASAVFETEAWGLTDQASYYNQCLWLSTPLHAEQLLQKLLSIEAALGRVRQEKYGPRTIDIDILFFNNDIINQPGLHIPHPQIQNRRFVLECLNDIAPQKMHPLLQRSVSQLLAACNDPLKVNKIP